MEKITLGPNQYFQADSVTVYKACRAAYGTAGIEPISYHLGWQGAKVYGTFTRKGIAVFGSVTTGADWLKLTPEQILFANAPDWAVDVRNVGDGFYYTDGVNHSQAFALYSGAAKTSMHKWQIIAARPQEQKVKTIDDAIKCFDGVWPEMLPLPDITGYWFAGDGRLVWSYVKSGLKKQKHICTREEFEARAAEMNKPWMPEVGQECEYRLYPDDDWQWCFFVGKDAAGDPVLELPESYHEIIIYDSFDSNSAIEFRPAKAEREKFIDAAMSILGNGEYNALQMQMMACLFDSGEFVLKLKED